MAEFSIAEFRVVANNDAVLTSHDRKRIGKRLRLLRLEQGLHQVPLAKQANISPGTLQNIEWGFRKSSEENIDKLARVLGTSLERLRGGSVDSQDPLVKGLNREDLEIARAYHEASSRVRQQARRLLRDRDPAVPPDAPHDDLVRLAEQMGRLPDAGRQLVATLIDELDRLGPGRQVG